MTRHEALGVLRLFAAAWPSYPLNDDTIELWVAELERVEPADGQEVAREMVGAEERFPSLALFRQSWRELLGRKALAQKPVAALPPAKDAGITDEMWAELRQAVRDIRLPARQPGGVSTPPPSIPPHAAAELSRRLERCQLTDHSRCGPDHDASAAFPLRNGRMPWKGLG